MDSFKKRFGQKLRARRIEKGFSSQSDLAEKLEVDQSRVSRWENGREFPDGPYRDKLMKVLKDESLFSLEPDAKPAPTVSSLLDAMKLMQAELDEVKSSPLYEVLKSADERLAREIADLAKAYLAATLPEQRAAFQILHPTFGDELELPDLIEKQSQSQTKKMPR